jgi:hypothetical protein
MRIKPWKVKKWGKSAQGISAPKQNICRILCHGKSMQENSINDLKLVAPTLGTFSPFIRLLDF